MFKPNQYLSSLQIIPQIPIPIIKSVLDFLLLTWTSKDEYVNNTFSKMIRASGKSSMAAFFLYEYTQSIDKINNLKLDNSLTPVLKT